MLASHHRPPWRLARRDRRIGANFHLRPAFCSSRSTVAFRPESSSSWPAYRLGLLPRAQRVRKRLHRISRKPDRSLRSGFPRLHLNSIRFPAREARTVESKSDWRGLFRRHHGFTTASLPSHIVALSHTTLQSLSLRSIHSPLVELSTECAGIMRRRRRLRIRLVSL